ncbi:MAG: tRNA pseudouridine(13) synthase TruD [Halobacteriales archaeon]
MRPGHPREQAVGMAHYVSDADGTGGRLRESPGDFRVREIGAVDPEPLEADSGTYRHLLVRATLRRWDTNEFAGELSDRLGVSRGRVGWAGTKDKHAYTTQLFSIEGIDADDLPGASDRPEILGADVEPVGRFGRQLQFGDLAGNAFEITVTDPDAPENASAVTAQLRAFAGYDSDDGDGGGGSDDGDGVTVAVPNYFGQQRFGSRRPVTHEVGLAVLRDDWKGAVLAYVSNPNEAEPEDTRAARAYAAETGDWQGALDRMPDHLGYERAMLHALVECGAGDDAGPEEFRTALGAVPENLQRMFVHAAQSYAFNRILSARLDRGLPFGRAVEGDIVCFAEDRGSLAVPDPDRTQRVTEGRVRAVNRHIERGRAFVTAPLVGTGTEFGRGEPGAIEREVLADLDLEPADFELPEPFDSTGTRRAIQLRAALDTEADPLGFSFSLPKGSYATVLLREYLKTHPERL